MREKSADLKFLNYPFRILEIRSPSDSLSMINEDSDQSFQSKMVRVRNYVSSG